VGAWVRRALLTVTCARWVEAGLVGLGCALGLCAIAIHEGTEDAPRMAAALTGFVAAALAWGRAQRPAPAQLAARIDTALHMDGAFVTAWQAEARSAGSNSMLELLIRQTLDGLRWRDVRRAVLPPSLVCVALPFAGAALLAGALQEAHTGQEPSGWEQSLAQELVHDLARARDAAYASTDVDDQTQESMAQLVADARGLSSGAQSGPEALPDREQLAQLAQDLAQVAPMTQADPRVDSALERAASALAALQAAANSSADPDPMERTSGDPVDPSSAGATNSELDLALKSAADQSQGNQAARAQAQAGAGSDTPGSSGTPGGQEPPLEAAAGDLAAAPASEGALSGLDFLELLPFHRRALARRWIQLQAQGK
jgi:hypothetical protein